MSDGTPKSDDRLRKVSGLVYGTHLRGALPAAFKPYLRSAVGSAVGRVPAIDVSYRVIGELPAVDEFWIAASATPLDSRFALFRQPAGFGLKVVCDGGGLFRFTPQSLSIEWLPGGCGAAHAFFSYALPLWLEWTGVPVLHASAVAWGQRAVAFVGPSGVGKSTLCAGLIRSGCSFVADDGLALREDERSGWWCAPGPPLLRLWPSALERHLGVPAETLPRVRDALEKRLMPCVAGAVAGAVRGWPLTAVYRLERRPEDSNPVTTSPYTARQSLVLLLQHGLAAAPVEALGGAGERLQQLSRLALATPVRSLSYPAGEGGWRRIRQALFEEDTAAGWAAPCA